jgi:hypothetical protein
MVNGVYNTFHKKKHLNNVTTVTVSVVLTVGGKVYTRTTGISQQATSAKTTTVTPEQKPKEQSGGVMGYSYYNPNTKETSNPEPIASSELPNSSKEV